MAEVRIKELSTTMIEVRIPSEWAPLGRSMQFRYAERLAEAFSLDHRWVAQSVTPADSDTLVVKLSLSQ